MNTRFPLILAAISLIPTNDAYAQSYRKLTSCVGSAEGASLAFDLYGAFEGGQGFVLFEATPKYKVLVDTDVDVGDRGRAPALTGPIGFDFSLSGFEYKVHLSGGKLRTGSAEVARAGAAPRKVDLACQ